MKRCKLIWIPLAYAAIFCCGGCEKRVQVKEQTALQIDNSKQLDDTKQAESNKIKSETVSKTVGPVVTLDTKTIDTFGWVPPPPEAPKGTPSQWKPVQHTVEQKETKAAASTTEKQIDTQQHATAGEQKHETDKGRIAAKTWKDNLTETIVGLSWQIKLAILIGAVVLLLGVVAYFNPNLLGLPAKALRWVVALVRRKPTAPPEEPK